jgi:hypothetical protein
LVAKSKTCKTKNKLLTDNGISEDMIMQWYNLNEEDLMDHKMLQHAKRLLNEKDEDGSSLVAICTEKFHKIVTALRTAVANEYKWDKEQTSYNEI